MIKKDILLQQYKLYVESAEKVSDRRQSANSYFLALNSLILSFAGYLTTFSFRLWHIVIAASGISISILWLLTLKSFRSLNSAKFKVIHSLEEDLPAELFKKEWEYLDRGKKKRTYLKLSLVEQGIPLIFIILYVIIVILMIYIK